MRIVFEKLSAWWRELRTQPTDAGPRYVRKPKIVGRTTYAARAALSDYVGRHHKSARRTAQRAVRVVREAVEPRHGRRRAPSGIALMLKRAHGAGSRKKSPARSRRLGDLTGEIPRRIAYHGARVKLTLRRQVRSGAWVVA